MKKIGIAAVIAFVILFLLASLKWGQLSIYELTLGSLGMALFLFIIGFVIGKFNDKFIKKVGKTAVNAFQYKSFLRKLVIGLTAAFIGSILAKIHLRYFDKKFLEQGKIDK